jgi:hypothetical protein
MERREKTDMVSLRKIEGIAQVIFEHLKKIILHKRW